MIEAKKFRSPTLMEDIQRIKPNSYEIREEYFEKYDRNNADDRICISWEYSRYKAFFNILINSLENIFEIIEETESNVLQQGLVEF